MAFLPSVGFSREQVPCEAGGRGFSIDVESMKPFRDLRGKTCRRLLVMHEVTLAAEV